MKEGSSPDAPVFSITLPGLGSRSRGFVISSGDARAVRNSPSTTWEQGMQATRYVSGVGCLTRVRIGLIVAFAILQLGLPSMASTARAGEALAEVNGDTITADEVERSLATQLGKLQEQIYTLKRQRLEALIRERLLAQEAAKRGVSVPALLDAEVTPKVRLITEEDVEKIYQGNKARFTRDEAPARERIRR